MTSVSQFACGALAALLAAPTLPGTLTLALLTGAGLLPARRPRAAPARGTIAVVVPAHNESAGIARTVRTLRQAAAADGDCKIVVVADQCTDDTAALARRAGARVIERPPGGKRGKGHALDFAFRTLDDERLRFFLVIDADSVIEAGYLDAVRRQFGDGAMALQTRYLVLDAGASWRTRLMELALSGFNVLRPRGRSRLGCSAGLLGNGFGLRREVLNSLPYLAGSVVEDLEYHLVLARHGVRVDFVDAAVVRAEMPADGAAAASQRARWEGGRLRMLRQHGPVLLRALLQGRAHAAEPLADLLLLPLAWHVLLLATLAALPLDWARTAGVGGLSVVLAHVLAAAWVGRLSWRHLSALLCIPAYIGWKLLLLPRILRNSGSHQHWVRTARKGEQP